jgi:hypothetical protein
MGHAPDLRQVCPRQRHSEPERDLLPSAEAGGGDDTFVGACPTVPVVDFRHCSIQAESDAPKHFGVAQQLRTEGSEVPGIADQCEAQSTVPEDVNDLWETGMQGRFSAGEVQIGRP